MSIGAPRRLELNSSFPHHQGREMITYPVRSPVFSQTVVTRAARVRTSHPSGSRHGDGSGEPYTPAPGHFMAPENCRDAMPCPSVRDHKSCGSGVGPGKNGLSECSRSNDRRPPRGVGTPQNAEFSNRLLVQPLGGSRHGRTSKTPSPCDFLKGMTQTPNQILWFLTNPVYELTVSSQLFNR